MALGLNGHLSRLTTLNIHDYLCRGHDFTGVGLLLGIATACMGSMDVATTRVLSIHVGALLPPTSTELDVSHVMQVNNSILYPFVCHEFSSDSGGDLEWW